jgi:tagaturonate epimerase
MGPRFLNALQEYEEIIAKHVTTNIYERHIRPLFLGD